MKQILYSWLPLLCAWLVLNLEEIIYIPLITAQGDIKANLAAFTLAYSLVLMCESFLYPVLSGSNVFSKDKVRSEKFFRFVLSLSLVFFLIIFACSTEAIGSFLFGQAMNLEQPIVALTLRSLAIMSLSPLLVGYRRYFQGILIAYGKSKIITVSSFCRLFTIIIVSLIVSQFFYDGVLVVSVGSISGMCIDALISRYACRHLLKSMPTTVEEKPQNFLAFYLPLGMSSVMLYLSLPVVNFFCSFGAFPVESLAAIGPILAVMYVLKSFGISFQEIVVSRWSGNKTENVCLQSTMYLISVISLFITAIFCFSPTGELYLSKVSGLTEELKIFSLPAMKLLFLQPMLMVAISYAKGIFIKTQQTRVIFLSSLVEILSLICVLSIGVVFVDSPAIEKVAIAILLSNLAVLGYLFSKDRKNFLSLT